MTISMTTIETIRQLDDEGMSRRAIAKAVSVSRATVDKYVNQDDFSPIPPVKLHKPGSLALGETLCAVIDRWLEQDQRMPRKQRHTAQRICDRLAAEHGYTGSYSPVQRYVKQWRQDHKAPGDGFMELEWSPGVIQVDFGQAEINLASDVKVVHLLVVTFPYSNMRFCRAFAGETAECVITGLLDVIDAAGGVPTEMVFDNATAIGRRVGPKVVESELFAAFKAHYRTRSRYCNPYSGHEKGNVENAVGFIRRNLLVPVPEVASLAELNALLDSGCAAFAKQTHYKKAAVIADLFQHDQQALKACPSVRFNPVRFEVRRTDKTGIVTVAGNRYLVGPAWANRQVTLELSHDTITVLDEESRRIIALPRVFGTADATVINPISLLPGLAQKPGAWKNSPLRLHMPDNVVGYLDEADTVTRREFFTHAQTTAAECGFDATVTAAAALLEANAQPTGPHLGIAARYSAPPPTQHTRANLATYDQLLATTINTPQHAEAT